MLVKFPVELPTVTQTKRDGVSSHILTHIPTNQVSIGLTAVTERLHIAQTEEWGYSN